MIRARSSNAHHAPALDRGCRPSPPGSRLEAAPGLEPGNNGFAIRRLSHLATPPAKGEEDTRTAPAVKPRRPRGPGIATVARPTRTFPGKWRNRQTHRT